MHEKDSVEIVCILDKSGSMYDLTTATCGGFNEFVQEQKKLPGKAKLSLVLFDTEMKTIHSGKMLEDVGELTAEDYCANGMTALMDAMGATLTSVRNRITKTLKSKRPSKVVVLIITDGLENSSVEWNRESIRSLVTDLQDNREWDFVYMGANQDSFAESAAYGIGSKYVENYIPTAGGVRGSWAAASASTTTARGTQVNE